MNGNKTRLFIRKAFRFLFDVINSLDEADKKKYANSLETMRRRLHDPEFRLAIVGNFNCGKSTFLSSRPIICRRLRYRLTYAGTKRSF